MIINELAMIVNDFINTIYSSGIKFYQIIIGLFIFNVIIYNIALSIYANWRFKQ